MQTPSVFKNVPSWLVLTLSILLPLGVGAFGGATTARAVTTWYAELRKPAWNPPNWVFAPVWTLLYIVMGIAAWMVWDRVGFGPWLVPYLLQLFLNMGWSFLFFGQKNPGLAFAEILLLWASVGVTMVAFWSIAPSAGILFVPYFAWVTFASLLNRSVWILNRART